MVTEKDGFILFDVKVTPHGREDKIFLNNGEINIRINSAPVEGRANKAVKEFLSVLLSVPGRNITILRGLSSRHKLIKVLGMTKKEFLRIIET
jgi:hypothetical protein